MEIANTPYTIFNGQERPLSKAELNSVKWPEFMLHDEVSGRYWHGLAKSFAAYQFAIFERNQLVGFANTIPLSMDAGRIEYNDRGWGWAMEKGFADLLTRRKFTVLCGLQIGICEQYQGKGLSALFIDGMRLTAREHGLKTVILPLRPTLKCKYPLVDMEDYVNWQDHNGQLFDPWLRAHVKLGGQLMRVCRNAMYIKGSINEWQEWTGLSFQSNGKYIVEGALTPVTANLEKDLVEYTEPNVWVKHNP